MEDTIFAVRESFRANDIIFSQGLEREDGPLLEKSTKTELRSGVRTVRSCDIVGLSCSYSQKETVIQGYVHSKQSPKLYLVILRSPPSTLIENAVYSCTCKAKDRKTRCSHACAIILAASLIFFYNPHEKKPKWMDVSRVYTKNALETHLRLVPRAQFLGRSSYPTLLYSMIVGANHDLVKDGLVKRHAFFFGADKKSKTTSWPTAVSHYATPLSEEQDNVEEPQVSDAQAMADSIVVEEATLREEKDTLPDHGHVANQAAPSESIDSSSNDNAVDLQEQLSTSAEADVQHDDTSTKQVEEVEREVPRRSLCSTFRDKEAILTLGKRVRKRRRILDL